MEAVFSYKDAIGVMGRFGIGQIIKITGGKLTVDFGHSGLERIRQSYVEEVGVDSIPKSL
jgi:hypothetical protein